MVLILPLQLRHKLTERNAPGWVGTAYTMNPTVLI